MLQRAGSKFRIKGIGRMLFIFAVVLIAFWAIYFSAAAEKITITVIQFEPTHTEIKIQIDYNCKIIHIKKMICSETGINERNQRLLYNGNEMEDYDYLRLYVPYMPEIYLFLKVTESSPSPSYPDDNLQFFRLCDECMLPATGFSSLFPAALSVQPKDLRYTDVGMRLMIPSLDLDSELVSVPMDGNSWAVEWLDDRGGVLEGSALPGEGFSVVAAHNTLNDMEYGPFALLGTLELNELIAVSGIGSGLRTFRVFANELLAPDDIDKMASIAEREENSLVLITCENESVDGGYLNRRVIFAKPVF